MDVSCLGVRDKELEGYFQDLLQDRENIRSLLEKNPNAYNIFLSYFQKGFGINDIRPKENEKLPFWFRSIRPVRIDNETTQEREIFYLMRSTRNTVQAVGIVNDDSVDRELAHDSVIDVSRYIGVMA